jgi:hypothetical protein
LDIEATKNANGVLNTETNIGNKIKYLFKIVPKIKYSKPRVIDEYRNDTSEQNT